MDYAHLHEPPRRRTPALAPSPPPPRTPRRHPPTPRRHRHCCHRRHIATAAVASAASATAIATTCGVVAVDRLPNMESPVMKLDPVLRPGHGGGSFLPWVSPPQRCPGVRRTPGIIGPGKARGVVITSIRRGVWPGVGIHDSPSFPFRKLATVWNVPEHRSGPSRSDVPSLEDKLSLSYYTSDGMDSKSQSHTMSHTQSNQVPVSPRAKYPGYHKEGAGPGCGAPRVSRQRSLYRYISHLNGLGPERCSGTRCGDLLAVS